MGEIACHIFRELNGEADALAGLHHNASSVYEPIRRHNCFRLFFDGSKTETGAGGGWVLYLSLIHISEPTRH
eukprot:10840374-Karenia_brevis.AAC.1